MKAQEFWDIYLGAMTPAEFMAAFDDPEPEHCVAVYVRQRPAFFGIVRRTSWRETFRAERQFNRAEVAAGLTAWLEETREQWEEPAAAARTERAARRAALEARMAAEAAAPQAPQDTPPPVTGDAAEPAQLPPSGEAVEAAPPSPAPAPPPGLPDPAPGQA
ncbi:MAG: hypothetical protein GXY15_07080 [Candidatus Hydrogenedentes bacterium]|nr:hypothetical protein [Candidatus Hydrogenedentota bacterium]